MFSLNVIEFISLSISWLSKLWMSQKYRTSTKTTTKRRTDWKFGQIIRLWSFCWHNFLNVNANASSEADGIYARLWHCKKTFLNFTRIIRRTRTSKSIIDESFNLTQSNHFPPPTWGIQNKMGLQLKLEEKRRKKRG